LIRVPSCSWCTPCPSIPAIFFHTSRRGALFFTGTLPRPASKENRLKTTQKQGNFRAPHNSPGPLTMILLSKTNGRELHALVVNYHLQDSHIFIVPILSVSVHKLYTVALRPSTPAYYWLGPCMFKLTLRRPLASTAPGSTRQSLQRGWPVDPEDGLIKSASK